MRQTRKVELHLHLGGSWPLEYLREIAEPVDFAKLVHFLALIKNGIDYREGFAVFPLIAKIVNTDEKVCKGVIQLCKELARDNVALVEIRTGLKDLGSGLEGYLISVLQGMETGASENSIKLGLVLSLRRDTPEDIAEKTIDLALKYREKRIVGIDLSGDSTKGNGTAAVNAIVRAKKQGLPATIHLGESEEETSVDQMRELSTIQPERVGHGVHLCDDAKAWIEKHNTPLEMCLSSAVKVKMIDQAESHPGMKYIKDKHPVLICTDDPLVFQTSLSEECAIAATVMGLSVKDMEDLQSLALEHSFIK